MKLEIKRGTLFLHRHYLEADLVTPLLCRVTKVARGLVYWRAAEGGSPYMFDLEEAPNYVKEIIS